MTGTESRVAGSYFPAEAPDGPGAQLRAAREAAGYSIEQVAQYLKLAPRQVLAIEEETFAELPGRTFIRGFVRNYARLFNLDAATLLSLLPDARRVPGLEAPELHATSTVRGELPENGTTKIGVARWAIPLLLIAIIAGVLWYEWHRGALPGLSGSSEAERVEPAATGELSPMPSPMPARAAPSTTTTAPSPMIDITPAPANEAAPTGNRAGEPSAGAATSAATLSTPASPASATAANAGSAEASLSFNFSGPSWVEVRDATGAVLTNRLNAADSTRTLSGKPPFIISIGNANHVQLSFDGHKIDLAPFTDKNVARLSVR